MKTTLISLFMLLLVVSLAAVTQSVDFNNTSDMATYFNNSYADVTNTATGGIGNTGAVSLPFLWTTDSRTITYKNGFAIGQLDQPITISAFIYSQNNGGYAGLGISSLPTNTTSSLCQVLNTSAFGMEFYSSAASLYNNSSEQMFSYAFDIPLAWYKVVLTITPRAELRYDLEYQLYLTDSNASFLTLTKQGNWNVLNATIGNVDGKVYPYLTGAWHRVSYMDNFYFNAPDVTPATVTIEPAYFYTPILAAVIGDLEAVSTGMIQAAYLCTYYGTTDLEVPLLAGEHGYAHYSGAWHEGDYALNPGFVTWLAVPFGAKGSIPVVIVEPAETLPVTLSSFTAVPAAQSFVSLAWVSESESNMMGYRIYRGESNDPTSATLITPVMIGATNTSSQVTYKHEDHEVALNTTYYYWLESVDMMSSEMHGPISATVTGNVAPELPTATVMSNVYPNPFRMGNNANIDVALKAGEAGTVTVYNTLGQSVKTFPVTQGTQKLTWNGRDNNGNACGSGIYFYRLSTPSMNQTKKMVIVK